MNRKTKNSTRAKESSSGRKSTRAIQKNQQFCSYLFLKKK
jgi:hypothetical protein